MTGGKSVGVVTVADLLLVRAGRLRAQMGTLAFEQLIRLADAPTPETAAALNSIWVRTLFVPVLNALLRDVPEAAAEIRSALVALGTVPVPLRADNRDEWRTRPVDTLEEWRGER